MRVTCNVEEVTKQLEALAIDVEKRMINMVHQFSYGVASSAVDYTPLGNAEQYPNLYAQRQQIWHLQPKEGYARGSWQVALDGSLDRQEFYGAGSGADALSAVDTHLRNYRLGEDILIGNPAHYIGQLEGLTGAPSSKKAPQGIMKPATEKIMGFYALKLDDYYNQNKTWSGGWQ